MKYYYVIVFLFLSTPFEACKKEKLTYNYFGETYIDHATDIVVALQCIELPNNHLWQRCGWWNSANVLEAELDYHRLAGKSFASRCEKIFSANAYYAEAGFKTRSYDDNAWWALTWIKAYDLYSNTVYLETAEDLFADMVQGAWDEKCGGGVAWQTSIRYKNAITNELFITLAAKLAQRQHKSWRKLYYLDWAIRGWNWLEQSGMRNSAFLFNDGLDDNCDNNHETTWTYNQGVVLGALKELYVLTGDNAYLQIAKQTAFAAMQKLSDSDNILSEPLFKTKNEYDCVQFKGVFVRYLSELNVVLKDPQIKTYILHNADVAWAKDQNEKHLFDKNWQGPYEDWKGASTGVALDLMNAAATQVRL